MKLFKLLKIIIIFFIACYIGLLFIESITRSTYDQDKQYDYLVIPGSIMKEDGTPELMMSQRVDAAEEIIAENPGITVIASGAQGLDESISEASAIKQELIRRGHNSTPIMMEESAISTATNLKYSADLVEGNVVIVSQQFHLFRIKFLLKRFDLDWDVAKVKNDTILPLQPFYREPFAIVKSIFFDH